MIPRFIITNTPLSNEEVERLQRDYKHYGSLAYQESNIRRARSRIGFQWIPGRKRKMERVVRYLNRAPARVSFVCKWFDFWIGIFWDRKKHWLYILPLPMMGIVIRFKRN